MRAIQLPASTRCRQTCVLSQIAHPRPSLVASNIAAPALRTRNSTFPRISHNIHRLRCAAASSAFPGQPDDVPPLRPSLTPDGIIDPDGTVVKQPPMDPEEKRLLWKRAIKLPMYSVGLAPVLVSAMAAWIYTGAMNPLRTLGFCVAAVAIIGWLNLSNDVFDSSTGVDKTKPESVVNLTGSRGRVLAVAVALLISGTGLLFHLLSSVVSLILWIYWKRNSTKIK